MAQTLREKIQTYQHKKFDLKIVTDVLFSKTQRRYFSIHSDQTVNKGKVGRI